MRKLLSISLALLLFLGNSGITMATHYCGGMAMLSELSIGNDDLNCGMEITDHEYADGQTYLSGPKCCENHYNSFEVDEPVVPGKTSIDNINFIFLTSFVYSFSTISVEQDLSTNLYEVPIPLVIRDLNVHYEVFRI
ncbi:HYC_CC_PP family protein [Marinigracilibium pacificum]|uniref:Secreted protein n=1 Tax=Marinigracilibium pacificum TaxID=2729599 RepID=A0A848J1A7_9BACT|nr:hypothetical protein [Marinigracilibium pacificum]NMM48264.1 hypothetical protein [Marinigracilibium pacificum]